MLRAHRIWFLLFSAVLIGGCQTSGVTGKSARYDTTVVSNTMLDTTVKGDAKAIAECLWGKLDSHVLFTNLNLRPERPRPLGQEHYLLGPERPLRCFVKPSDKPGSLNLKVINPGQSAPAGADLVELTYDITVKSAAGGTSQIVSVSRGPTKWAGFFTATKKAIEHSVKVCAA